MGKTIWLHGRVYIKSLVFRHIMLLYAWNSLLKYVLRALVVDSFNFNLQGSAEFVYGALSREEHQIKCFSPFISDKK